MQLSKENNTDYLLYSLVSVIIVSGPNVLFFASTLYDGAMPSFNSFAALKHLIKELIVNGSFVSLLALPMLIPPRRFGTVYGFLLTLLLFLPSLVDYAHVSLFGVYTYVSAYYAIFATNGSEAVEFVADFLNISLYGPMIVYCIIITASVVMLKRIRWIGDRKLAFMWLLGSFLAAGLLFASHKSDMASYENIPALRFLSAYRGYRGEINQLIEAVNDTDKRKFKQMVHRSDMDKLTLVVVIGESTGRNHMEIYGYHRNTNPELNRIRDELFVFTDVVSPDVHTVRSLSKALTFANHDDMDPLIGQGSLIDLLNQAGFVTYWLSNQHYLGEHSTPVSILAQEAKVKRYINQDWNKTDYDEVLLAPLGEAISENGANKAIFVHLMGTHGSYGKRYPSDFEYFKSDGHKAAIALTESEMQTVNQYDNAVRYNDHIVSSIIQLLKSSDDPVALVYFSDHGDEVYDFRHLQGHYEALISGYMVEIPFILWLNTAYKTRRSDISDSIHKYVNRKYGAEDLIHSIQDLAGVQTEYYEPDRSIFNRAFKNKKRIVGTWDYDKAMAGQDNYRQTVGNVPDYQEKIWVHRVNSIERLKIVEDKFRGIELDVVFNANKRCFDVGHPPVESIGLCLETYFESVRDLATHYFWLDFKNLSRENREKSLERLNELTGRFHIKNNLIVESANPEWLGDFSNNGFVTSYYLPDVADRSEAEIKDALDSISLNILHSGVCAVSQGINSYGIMNKYLGGSNKLLWDLSLNWEREEDRLRASQLLSRDTTLRVLLVRYDSEGYR